MLCSTLAALGGILAASRLAAANQASGGGDVNLNAIAAAVIGGTSLFGGRGSAFSALLGIVVIQSISSGLTLLSLDSSFRFIVTGLVLLLAVGLDSVARRSRGARPRLSCATKAGSWCRGRLLLGIDIGTGSSKGVLATPDGGRRDRGRARTACRCPGPGWAEMDAEAVWWGTSPRSAASCWRRRAGRAIAGVCVSGVGPVPACSRAPTLGRCAPAILYGIDTRATAEIAELTERYGADAILERCGKALDRRRSGPKLRWVRRHEPEVWARERGAGTAAARYVWPG